MRLEFWGAMRCTNCGSTINPNSRFCDQCGAPAPHAEETRIARPQSSVPVRHDDDDIEHVVFTVRPTMLFIKIGYAAAIMGAILLTVLLAMVRFVDIPWFYALPVARALLLIPASYHINRNTV